MTTTAIITPLTRGWSLHQERRASAAPGTPPVPADVPGCVHTDLLAAGIIPDPFVGINEADVEWVADCDWRYSCDFEVDLDHLAHRHLDLKFFGLDTLATVLVNEQVVAETANMHRRYRFDIRPLVHVGRNRLDIVFRSAARYAEQVRATEGEWPAASFGRAYPYLRKMACSWGWDWGPRLTTAGIWRPAHLEAWSYGRLSDVRPRPHVDAADHGVLDIDVDYVASKPETGVRLRCTLSDADGDTLAASTVPVDVGTTRVRLDAGPVRRWWPHSLGDPALYTLNVELLCPDDIVHATRTMRIGFRTIELDTSTDSIGSAFTLVVNGVPIFARGANWIPDDMFVTRVDASRLDTRIRQAVEANVDLLRVWGGGIYEDDAFYDACDERGVLVWQDFMFACAAYPEHLLADEVEAEAYGNVSRLMGHPSIALWNGNNENQWGYADWGWTEVLGDRAWGAGFYHDLLPRICAELDPDRPYWPGSPWSGSGEIAPNADEHGCTHVWDVWNDLDLDHYRDHAPRFVAEFGWQAPATARTLEQYVGADHLTRHSPAWSAHQKAIDGDRKLDRGVDARFGSTTDVDAFCVAAQIVQARAVRTGVEHFRSLKPLCMGTIWWQLNDCWPATSWAVVDWLGRRKPAWYALRDAYRPQLLTIQPRAEGLTLVAVNDGCTTWRTRVTVTRRRFDGMVLAAEDVSIDLAPGAVASCLLGTAVAEPSDPFSEVVHAAADGQPCWWWFAHDRELELPRPRLSFEATDGDGCIEVSITSDVVVRDLVIEPDRLRAGATIDRQVVSLLPDEPSRFVIAGVALTDVEALLNRPYAWHAADLIG